jgi:hypothetical protein
LELKTQTGRATDAQLDFVDAVKAAGGFGTVAYGLGSAIKVLEAWGLVTGRLQ